MCVCACVCVCVCVLVCVCLCVCLNMQSVLAAIKFWWTSNTLSFSSTDVVSAFRPAYHSRNSHYCTFTHTHTHRHTHIHTLAHTQHQGTPDSSASLNMPSNLLVNCEPHSALSLAIIVFSASMLALLFSSRRLARSFL